MRVVLLSVVLFVVHVAPAIAEEAHGGSNGSIIVTDHADGEAGRGGGGVGASDRPVYGYWAIIYVAEGFCRVHRFTTDQEQARAYTFVFERRSAEQANGLDNLAACPVDAPVVRPPSPGDLARDFWDVRLLPSPTLETVPGHAVVGRRVYLRIVGPSTTTFDVPNPIGAPVHIAAASRYLLDWGDGTPPTTTASQGGPWPHGDVTHVYDAARPAAAIRVTQLWSAAWSAPPNAGGPLDNLRTLGELTIRVEQVQPVRNR